MKISVIIPVFNGESTIAETIESVLQQTYQNLEAIVINDGSTDSTEAIVKSFTDPRLQIYSYPNAGLAASRNRGIAHASGEYISFIDADDLWTQDKLELQLSQLQKNKQAAVAYSWTDYIDKDSKFFKLGKRIQVSGDTYSKLLLSNFLENGSNPLILADALKSVGGFDESLSAAEDWDMWLRLAAQYDFVCVEKAQILYRLTTHSMSANLKRQEAASLTVINRAFSHGKVQSRQHLKKYAIANIYKYLTFRAIELSSGQKQSTMAVCFLWNWVKNDPGIFKQMRLILIAIVKITIFHF